MRNSLRSLTQSPLLIMALLIAVLFEVFQLAAAPPSLPPVLHPPGCHACFASVRAAAEAHDIDPVRIGALEIKDPFGSDVDQK